jgi:hypothetical protein
MTSLNKILTECLATVLWFAVSQLHNCCTTTILYGWKFKSLCKILFMLQLDIPRATECLLAECIGLLIMVVSQPQCSVAIALYAPGGFFFNMEAPILNFFTHKCAVLWQGSLL